MDTTFEFVGTIVKPKKDMYEEREFSSGWKSKTIKFQMVSGTDSQWVEIRGGSWKDDRKNDFRIQRFCPDGEKGESVEVAWADRNNPDVIDMISRSRRYVFGEYDSWERKEYSKSFDMVDYVHNFLQNGNYEGQLFKVCGTIDFQYSNTQSAYYRAFAARTITPASEDDLPGFTGKADIYFVPKTCVDDEHVDSEGRYALLAYVQYYASAVKEKRFAPIPIALYKDNDMDVHFGEYIENSRSEDAEVMHCLVNLRYVNGAPKVAVKEGAEQLPELTAEQERMLKYGLITKEQLDAERRKEIENSDAYGKNIVREIRYNGLYGTAGTKDTTYYSSDLLKTPVPPVGGAAPSASIGKKEEKPVDPPTEKKIASVPMTSNKAILDDIFGDDDDEI